LSIGDGVNGAKVIVVEVAGFVRDGGPLLGHPSTNQSNSLKAQTLQPSPTVLIEAVTKKRLRLQYIYQICTFPISKFRNRHQARLKKAFELTTFVVIDIDYTGSL
jgi:hypothetical protein